MSQLLGCSGKAILTDFAEAGFNVDATNELSIARSILEKQSKRETYSEEEEMEEWEY
jgi:hypothetical protein